MSYRKFGPYKEVTAQVRLCVFCGYFTFFFLILAQAYFSFIIAPSKQIASQELLEFHVKLTQMLFFIHLRERLAHFPSKGGGILLAKYSGQGFEYEFYSQCFD